MSEIQTLREIVFYDPDWTSEPRPEVRLADAPNSEARGLLFINGDLVGDEFTHPDELRSLASMLNAAADEMQGVNTKRKEHRRSILRQDPAF